MRMNIVNFLMAAHRAAAFAPSRCGTLFGVWANWQLVGFIAFGRECLVADSHLDVVGLAREDQQRLVLRLPAEAGDRPVVAVVVGLTGDRIAAQHDVGPAADAERLFGAGRGGLVLRGSRCRESLDQARPNVGVGMRKITLLLASAPRSRAARCCSPGVAAAGDGEQPVHAAVGRAVGDCARTEPRAPGRSARMNEGTVLRAPILLANATCGLTGGLVPPRRRLRVAAAAAVEVHRRTQPAFGDVFASSNRPCYR